MGVARETHAVSTGLMAQGHVSPPLPCVWPSVFISLLECAGKVQSPVWDSVLVQSVSE